MASHQLIEEHLAALRRSLPAHVVDELADGLTETWHRHLAAGLPPPEAARAAIAEFGTPAQITDAFVTQAPGRKAALLLLATGPIAALSWGTALITAHAWSWPVPTALAGVLGAVLVFAVAALLVAATSRHSYRRTRVAGLGGLAVAGTDVMMLMIVLAVAPTHAWPLITAVTVSLVRIAVTTRLLPRTLAR